MTESKVLDRTTGDGELGASRRAFLRSAGLGGALLAFPALFTACGAELTSPTAIALGGPNALRADAGGAVVLDFSNDFGVLNFAYALEQLEAAFYVMVLAHPYQGITERELRLLRDVRDHEIVHKDFLKAALGAQRIRDLTPNLSAVDFTSRGSVLGTARTFEDLGVAAYNGAAHYIADDVYLTIAGKIVSVEARHASAIRDLLMPRSGDFAPKAFDDAFTPTDVVAAAQPFIVDQLTVINS